MKDYMVDYKMNLLIENYKELKEVKGSWQMGMVQHGCALSFALRGKHVNSEKVDECMKIIKDNTGIFSSFRGYSIFYMASLLSFEVNPESSFKIILEIYEKLKEAKFRGDTYLSLAATIIYENRDKIDIDSCILKMKKIYENMKNKHPFLTSSDDYCNSALLSIYSECLDEDLEHMEECYSFLGKNGFYKGNDLQALSQVLLFSEDKSMGKCKKAIDLRNCMNSNDCKMYGYGYPIIGAISLLNYEEDKTVKKIKMVSNELKEIKGFGNWSLGKSNRTMISAAIVASTYSDQIGESNNIDSITSKVFINIIIAIEISCMIAIMTASSASASSN